jgi:hypothetical protein
MDRSAMTASSAARSAATCPLEESDVDAYAGFLRDLREALQEPAEFAFRAGEPQAAGSRMAA